MQTLATQAAHRAIQFPGLFARSAGAIRPFVRNVQPTYENQVRDQILRCTRQMSGQQSQQQKAKFLAGVDVKELSWADWARAEAAFVIR